MGSPDASEPPIAPPTRASKSAVTAPSAALRVAFGVSSRHRFTFVSYSARLAAYRARSSGLAALSTATGAPDGAAGQPGETARPPYHPPKCLPAAREANTITTRTVGTQV